MAHEAPLKPTEGGMVPVGDGWFVLNVADARWLGGPFGACASFEGETRFPHLGINIGVLEPGQSGGLYHGEAGQENFLVLAGECLLLIEREERRLRAWDFVHCPEWTEHVLIGAGDGPCTILAVGARGHGGIIYPPDELARHHGAAVERETRAPSEAYAPFPEDVAVPFRREWLSG